MKSKVKWYNKGNWEEDEIDIKTTPFIRIMKYKYSDSYSLNGYRFWAVRPERNLLLKNLELDEWDEMGDNYLLINDYEIRLVKDDTITLTNNYGEESNKFYHYKYSDLINKYGEEAIYF
jgi:hypothetical protein